MGAFFCLSLLFINPLKFLTMDKFLSIPVSGESNALVSVADVLSITRTSSTVSVITYLSGNTATITLPSFITDGTTGTDNLTLETFTQGDAILLESGTDIDRTLFDHIVLEDSLASRRSINTVGSEQQLSTDAGAFNLDIETDADGIIDFSEGNPFGDAT